MTEEYLERKKLKKLPVLEAAGAIYKQTWMNLVHGVRIVAPWIILIMIFYTSTFYAHNFFLTDISKIPFDLRSFLGLVGDFSHISSPATILTTIFTFLCWCAIAVQWHKTLLQGEIRPNFFFLDLKRAFFYFMMAVFYAILSLVVCAPFMAAFVITETALIMSTGIAVHLSYVAQIVIFVLGISVFVRFSLALPAIAVNPSNFSLFEGWRRSKANFLRIVGCSFLAYVPFLLFFDFVGFLADGLDEDLSGWAVYLHMFEIPIEYFYLLLGITQLTVLYRYFIEGDPV